MTHRIFRSICAVALAVFIGTMALIMDLLYGYFSDQQMKQLRQQARLAAQGVSHEGMAYFTDLDMDGCRMTWIGGDGDVLYDSEADAGAMDNHLGREEVQQVLRDGEGESRRYSATLTRRQMYVAVLLEDGSIIRVSDTQYTVLTLLVSLAQPIIIVVALGLGLSLFLASRLSRRIVKPLNDINPEHPESAAVYPELKPLVNRLRSQQNQLSLQKKKLMRKQHELEAATGSMQEGLVLLDEDGLIMSINGAAQRILSATDYCVGKDFMLVNHSFEIQNLLRRAALGEHATDVLTLNRVRYQVNASPIIFEGTPAGIVLLLIDITEKQKNEQLRREFTANVSHELKTPLHTIAGYAEMLASSMVRPEDVPKFSAQILSDAKRMTALVEDIIRLSHLDEGAEDMKREPVDLFALAQQATDSLRRYAEEAEVTLTLTGEAAPLTGIPQLLSLMIRNLCDNAIKYNRRGGSVNVNIENAGDAVLLSVSDTGIGIPEEQQSRVFERFYRVNKSRSRELGGTGLGLSIVKHAALLHNARIELSSVPGEGTCITVCFPLTDASVI